MNRLKLLIAVLCLSVSGQAATVSGSASFAPTWNVPHQSAWGTKVYLADSSAATASIVYLDSTLVNTSGNYTFTVPASITSGYIRTYVVRPGCGISSSSPYQSYTGSSLAMGNLVINCGGPYVRDTMKNATTGLPVYGKLVYLLDSTATHYYKDSAYTSQTGEVVFGMPPAITSGSLRIFTNSCGVQSQTVSYTGAMLWAPSMYICDSNVVVSGTLTDAGTSATLPNYPVNLADSAGTSQLYADSNYTDGAGHYSFTIPVGLTSGNMTVSALGCGSRYTASATFTGSNLTLNLSGCGATVSGTIYTTNGVRHATPVPAAGATVIVFQNLCMPCAPIITTASSSGTYSVAIPGYWVGTYLINVWDSAASGGCKGLHFGPQITYTGGSGSVVMNDTLCNYPWHTIGGKVTYQGGGAAAGAKVYLIRDTVYTSGPHVLTALDSTTTNSTGDYYFTLAQGWYSGSQHVKAALPVGHSNYANYLPTYGDSSLVWSGAATFTETAWRSYDSTLNISLRGGTNPGGAGFIGGSVLLGANKSTAVGDPLSERMLLLTTAAGKAVAFTYSNASGQFSFSNLANGSYLLFGDAWGKTNPPLAVTISAASPTVSNIIFEENSTEFKGHYNALGVSARPGLASISLYPNPASSNVSLQGLSGIEGDKQVVLRDIHGLVLSNTHIKAGSNASITVSQLPAGMYMLQVQTVQGAANYKFIKR